MKNPRLDLYIWPGDSKEKEDIHNFQGSLQVKMDIKAAIGAGASGLLPELNLLLIAGATLLTAGFLNAVGADGWKLIKKGVVKLATRKPSKKELEVSLPPDYKGPIQYELIWWIHFEDTKILILIGLSSPQEVAEAISDLPQAIDLAFQIGGDFSRLIWSGTKWDRY